MVILLLSVCNNDDRPINNAISVLCVNIHAGKTVDGESNLDALAELINQLAPDFVALQEVDVNTFRSGGIDMAQRLAEETGMHYAFGKAMDHGAGQYGNAILSITSLEQVENIALPQGQEPRSALKANANIDGKRSINIISTHFDSRDEDSRINSGTG